MICFCTGTYGNTACFCYFDNFLLTSTAYKLSYKVFSLSNVKNNL